MNEQRVLDKLDKLNEHLASIDKTLAINTLSLEEHVKRTNILQEKLKPVEDHVAQMRAWGKMIRIVTTSIAGLIAFAASIAKLLGKI